MDPKKFIRVHRSAIVNLDLVARFTGADKRKAGFSYPREPGFA
jgi:DNA-binding LytR/AlgR family response regulator